MKEKELYPETNGFKFTANTSLERVYDSIMSRKLSKKSESIKNDTMRKIKKIKQMNLTLIDKNLSQRRRNLSKEELEISARELYPSLHQKTYFKATQTLINQEDKTCLNDRDKTFTKIINEYPIKKRLERIKMENETGIRIKNSKTPNPIRNQK